MKSSKTDITSFSREESRPIASGRDKGTWELIPTTITEESNKTEMTNGNTSLEDEEPTPKSSPRKAGKSGDSTRELAKIGEVLREESTHSDLLSQTELQLRLSSIKKKVEVRKRGRDSRSSYSSDLDDSMLDLTTDRDLLNTSTGSTKPTKTSRASARSNITRISKQFQPNKQDLKN
ncbi:uncharacterized protein LOC123553757 [Mercenaria mercenaria]|uniref:uncharacterized protein LOC123553757 n=1 Tax=Mercenaria mercenaria TaxID=6596 RepID=UPI00234F2A45|nr:uncharacterized protein LOC123553757 [Mercenaria mercenaria]